jgi:MFS transporter, FHS family, Na+ dependent glucose transporter 1
MLRAEGPPTARSGLAERLSLFVRTRAQRLTAAYYLLFVCSGLDGGMIGPTLPDLARQTGSTLGRMGLLFLVMATGHTVGTAVSGRFFDRAPGHVVLGIALLTAAALIAAIPFAPHFWVLAALMACKGVTSSFLNTGANTLIVWTHRERSGPYLNGLHFVFGLGAFLSPLLVAQFAGSPGGYRIAYWALAALAALVGLRTLALPGSPRPVQRAGTGTAAAAGRAVPYAFVLAAALYFFFYGGAEITFRGWAYTYAVQMGLADAAGAAYLNAAFWLALTLGRLAATAVAARFKPQQIIPPGFVMCMAFMAIVMLFPGSSTALWIGAIGFGFFIGPLWATGFTLAGQSVDLSGRVSSLILIGNSLGSVGVPSIVGRVIETSGAGAMITLILGSLLLTLLAFGAMLRLRPRR